MISDWNMDANIELGMERTLQEETRCSVCGATMMVNKDGELRCSNYLGAIDRVNARVKVRGC